MMERNMKVITRRQMAYCLVTFEGTYMSTLGALLLTMGLEEAHKFASRLVEDVLVEECHDPHMGVVEPSSFSKEEGIKYFSRSGGEYRVKENSFDEFSFSFPEGSTLREEFERVISQTK